MLEARALHAGWILVVACATTKPAPVDAPAPAAVASQAPRSEDTSPAAEVPDGAAATEVGPTIERVEPTLGGVRLATKVGDCTLTFVVENARLHWRAAPDTTECATLAPGLKSAWVALARRARSEAPFPEKLLLAIGFRSDVASVETWFRYQAESADLQKLASGAHGVAYYKTVAQRMRESGALSRYADLLGAMGFDIRDVSVEKVEVLSASSWRSSIPASAEWKLPEKSRFALPNGTLLQLAPK